MGLSRIYAECNFTAGSSKLSSKLSSPRREKKGGHRSCHGVLCAKRDYELGMVTTDSWNDDEYRSLDRTGRMDSNSHWQVDKGVEGVIDSKAMYSYLLCSVSVLVMS